MTSHFIVIPPKAPTTPEPTGGSMNEKVQPVVNAANLGPEELAAWLFRVSRDAGVSTQDYSMPLFELESAATSLRYVSENLATRINFLSGPEIIRPEGHSTAIQAELDSLRVILAAVRDSQRTILSSVARLQQTAHSSPDLCQQAHLQECAEQESGKEKRGP